MRRKAILQAIFEEDTQSIKRFLDNHDFTKITQLEINTKAGLPSNMISKFMRNKRPLRPEHIDKLIPVLEKMGYKRINNLSLKDDDLYDY